MPLGQASLPWTSWSSCFGSSRRVVAAKCRTKKLGLWLEQHAPELSQETLQEVPRLVLVASSFDLDITTTAVFLTRKLLMEIQLIRVQAYRLKSGEVVVTTSKLFPPPDMDGMVLYPEAEEEQERKLERTREKNTVARLIAARALPDGAELRFSPGSEMTTIVRTEVLAWVKEAPERAKAAWRNHPGAPLIWAADGKAYSPTGLVKHIAARAGHEIRSIAGPRSWKDSSGRTLPAIADASGD